MKGKVALCESRPEEILAHCAKLKQAPDWKTAKGMMRDLTWIDLDKCPPTVREAALEAMVYAIRLDPPAPTAGAGIAAV